MPAGMFGVRPLPHRETGDRSPAGIGPNCPDIGRPANETVLLGESDKGGRSLTNTEDMQRYADAIMVMIKEDQDTRQVPRNVCSWDELDDSVDAGDYYRLARMPAGTPKRLPCGTRSMRSSADAWPAHAGPISSVRKRIGRCRQNFMPPSSCVMPVDTGSSPDRGSHTMSVKPSENMRVAPRRTSVRLGWSKHLASSDV